MHRVLIIGAGKIGSLIAFLLASTADYYVYLADQTFDGRPDLDRFLEETSHLETVTLDAKDATAIENFLNENPVQTLIPALPFYYNVPIAAIAKKFNLNYLDLTEDTATTKAIADLANHTTSLFIPQCGLAPGFISIVTNDLMQHFETLDAVKMRVGALPINISNGLQYSLTWSTDGLINEYGNLCNAIENGKEIDVLPLDDLEEIKIDGLTYEAFNTSGGIGSLAKTYQNKVQRLSYKTIRYPGHCAKMQFLMNDLKLNHDRDTLKHILENALPRTVQDVVLVYVSVSGMKDHQFCEENYVKKFYPKKVNGLMWSAIQLTTASGLCAVLDIALSQPDKYQGLIYQEAFSLDDITNNRFGHYYA